VHALIVGATPKPELLFYKTLFNKYDFPVLYRPATPIIDIGSGIDFSTSRASEFYVYFFVEGSTVYKDF